MRSPVPAPGAEANQLLAALPIDIQQRVAARGEVVPLPHKSVLIVPDTPIEYAYFPRSGCISLVTVMADGSTVEIGTIGWEGMCGVSLIHGFSSVPAKAIIQVPGDALRIATEELATMVQEEESLRSVLLRYAQLWANTIGRNGSCNAVHSVEERCARWLLMTHDRVPDNVLPLTQEFLAVMLGVRRASVTIAASSLQQAGLINYKHGKIVVLDRDGLEGAACECYEAIRRDSERLLTRANTDDALLVR